MINEFKINDFTLSYYDSGGSNDVVMLLHGFPSPYFFWNEIINDLEKKGKRVLAIEQRGYPLSLLKSPDIHDFNIENLSSDIESLIDYLEIDEVSIIAHDWGTIVAWAVLQRNIVEVNNLVSVCGGTEFPNTSIYEKLIFPKGEHYITSFQNPTTSSEYLDSDVDNFIRSAYRDTFGHINNPDLSMKSVFKGDKFSNLVISEEDVNKYSNHFISSSLFQPICWYSNINLNIQLSNSWRREVNTKVTFIFGKIDFTVQLNDKIKDRLRTLGNNIHIHEVDNAGHWLPLTHKESVIEHI